MPAKLRLPPKTWTHWSDKADVGVDVFKKSTHAGFHLSDTAVHGRHVIGIQWSRFNGCNAEKFLTV